ncbi:MAG: fumarate hydratase [Methanomassiliicoccales archaeon]|jgi:fumarate hydratase subunit alpha
MISPELVEQVVVDILRSAVTSLPSDVVSALEKAEAQETDDIARTQLSTILENIRCAEEISVPMCQDTGIPLFFVSGNCDADLEDAIRRGVARGTVEIPLRPNAVHPLTRKNAGNNLGIEMPYIHYSPGPFGFIDITVMPKGAGSENMSALRMFTPAEGTRCVKSFVLDTVVSAGGRPCPPTIVGVGIGGSSDIAMGLAKRALLRPLNVKNPYPELQTFEEEVLEAINETGIGPMGLGGRATSLGVRVGLAHCHTASLPVAVNIQCWSARRASARIFLDGRVVYSKEGFW